MSTPWGEEWEGLRRELEHVTPWGPEHVRPALERQWAMGRTPEWCRRVLLPAFDTAVDFEKTMRKVQETLALSPEGLLRFAEKLEELSRIQASTTEEER
jgi:hypothetical protein